MAYKRPKNLSNAHFSTGNISLRHIRLQWTEHSRRGLRLIFGIFGVACKIPFPKCLRKIHWISFTIFFINLCELHCAIGCECDSDILWLQSSHLHFIRCPNGISSPSCLCVRSTHCSMWRYHKSMVRKTASFTQHKVKIKTNNKIPFGCRNDSITLSGSCTTKHQLHNAHFRVFRFVSERQTTCYYYFNDIKIFSLADDEASAPCTLASLCITSICSLIRGSAPFDTYDLCWSLDTHARIAQHIIRYIESVRIVFFFLILRPFVHLFCFILVLRRDLLPNRNSLLLLSILTDRLTASESPVDTHSPILNIQNT